jgi:hypothetical protein
MSLAAFVVSGEVVHPTRFCCGRHSLRSTIYGPMDGTDQILTFHYLISREHVRGACLLQ